MAGSPLRGRVSLAVPLLFPLSHASRVALSMTSAVRYLSLALVVAGQHFSPATTLAVLVYGAVMYLLAAPVIVALRRRADSR